jgi:hypothetical protein
LANSPHPFGELATSKYWRTRHNYLGSKVLANSPTVSTSKVLANSPQLFGELATSIWRNRHIKVLANSPQLFGEQGIGELANSIDEQGIGELAQTIGKQSIGEPRPTYWRSLRLVSTLIHSFVFF